MSPITPHDSKQRRAYQELIVIIQITLSLTAITELKRTYRVDPCARCEFFPSDDILSSLRNKWGDIFLPHFPETLQDVKSYSSKKTSDLAQTGESRYLTCIKTFRRRHQQMTDRLTLFYSFAQFVQYTCSLPTACWDYERPVWCVGVWSVSRHTSASFSHFYLSASKRKTSKLWSKLPNWMDHVCYVSNYY